MRSKYNYLECLSSYIGKSIKHFVKIAHIVPTHVGPHNKMFRDKIKTCSLMGIWCYTKMLVTRKVIICDEKNLQIHVRHIKFTKNNTIGKLRVSWADVCNNTNTLWNLSLPNIWTFFNLRKD